MPSASMWMQICESKKSLQLPFREPLDTWHWDRRAVGPDRWRASGLLRQWQPNGKGEAGSIKDLSRTECRQAHLRHRAAQSQRVGGVAYSLEAARLAALPGGGGDHPDQVLLRLEQ